MDRPVEAISYAGARGEERPLAVRVDREAIQVTAVRQMWVETGLETGEGVRRWFRAELEDARILTIYYDEALESWFYRDLNWGA